MSPLPMQPKLGRSFFDLGSLARIPPAVKIYGVTMPAAAMPADFCKKLRRVCFE